MTPYTTKRIERNTETYRNHRNLRNYHLRNKQNIEQKCREAKERKRKRKRKGNERKRKGKGKKKERKRKEKERKRKEKGKEAKEERERRKRIRYNGRKCGLPPSLPGGSL